MKLVAGLCGLIGIIQLVFTANLFGAVWLVASAVLFGLDHYYGD